MPAPRKPSPSSPATSRTTPAGPGARGPGPGGARPSRTPPPPPGHRTVTATAMTRAEALRWWRAGYQAGRQAAEHEQQAQAHWDRLVASFHAQRAADQQARLDALLLEAIAALAGLFSGPDHPRQPPSLTAATAEDHRQDLPECPHQTMPARVQTAWPLTTRTTCYVRSLP